MSLDYKNIRIVLLMTILLTVQQLFGQFQDKAFENASLLKERLVEAIPEACRSDSKNLLESLNPNAGVEFSKISEDCLMLLGDMTGRIAAKLLKQNE